MVSLSDVEARKRWFQKLLEQNDYTYRSLAAKMDLAGPDVSRIVNGQRSIEAEEAMKLARLLYVSVDDVLKRAKAPAPIQRYERQPTKRTAYIPVVGFFGDDAKIVTCRTRRNVLRPARSPEDSVAYQCAAVSSHWRDWLFYISKTDHVIDQPSGKLSHVTSFDGEYFGFVEPTGARNKSVRIFNLDGKLISEITPSAISPVFAAKPE